MHLHHHAAMPPAAARADGGDARGVGLIFRGLPAFAAPSPELTAALQDIGHAGGRRGALDAPSAGPVAPVTDPTLSARSPSLRCSGRRGSIAAP